MSTVLNPAVPQVTLENYEKECLLVEGPEANAYLEEAKRALNLWPIPIKQVHHLDKIEVYWYPRLGALRALIEYEREAKGGMATSDSRGYQIAKAFKSIRALIGINNFLCHKRKKDGG